LYTTRAHTGDGRATVFPNPYLLGLQLYNFSRSLAYNMTIQLQVDIDTPREKLKTLEEEVLKYFRETEAGVWTAESGDMRMTKIDLSKMCTLEISATLNGITWVDGGKAGGHKSKFMYFLYEKCRELEITYSPPVQKYHLFKGHKKKDE